MIRLPPYYPNLNSIEKFWSSVKSRIAAKNVTFKLRDVQQLAEENFAAVNRRRVGCCLETCKNCGRRVRKIDSTIDRFIIKANEDDDTSKSSDGGSDIDIQKVGPLSSDEETCKQLNSLCQQAIVFESLQEWKGLAYRSNNVETDSLILMPNSWLSVLFGSMSHDFIMGINAG